MILYLHILIYYIHKVLTFDLVSIWNFLLAHIYEEGGFKKYRLIRVCPDILDIIVCFRYLSLIQIYEI